VTLATANPAPGTRRVPPDPLNELMRLKRFFLLACLTVLCAPLWALTQQQALAMAEGDSDRRIAALQAALADPDARLLPYLTALSQDAVKVKNGQVFVIQAQGSVDPMDGHSVELPPDADEVMLNNRLRGEIDAAIASLQLFAPEAALRRRATAALIKEPDVSKRHLIERAMGQETSDDLKTLLSYALAAIDLTHAQAHERRLAAQRLSQFSSPDVQRLLNDQLQKEIDPTVRAQLAASLKQLNASLAWGDRLGVWFTGLSLGSVLLLVALGLAITYGLMGVINMAHGELMMIGAYATYVVQNLFKAHLPGWFDAYLLAAVPCAFLAAALVGALLERLVLRHLYGRPLETLLATWGISLILMQAVRSLFGAQNVAVENPAWMSGGMNLLSNLTLPWNRVLIIAFSLLVLSGMTLLITRTRLGLFVRGVTQNRSMASCMGVNTARTDTYAFALGSGIAGLAGCALSQIGNVGPDLGQSYIVDAFMVVVLGGVGQLAGTVYAALGLGVLNKLLEGWTGAVLAKIAVLVLIVVFIQKRPQGLFALKGRSVEA
jgi:urea transport system permease protein